MNHYASMLLAALTVFSTGAKADLFCKDLKVPTIEIAVKAGKNQVLVPTVAFVEILDYYKFTLESIDDGFWIPITYNKKLDVEHDTAKNVIRIKEQTIPLKLMRFASKPTCQFVQRVKVSLNEKVMYYDKEFEQGSQFPRLTEFGPAKKDVFASDKDAIKNLLKERKYEINLPGQERLQGEVSVEGEHPDLHYRGYFITSGDVKTPITRGELTREESDCIVKLAQTRKSITVLGRVADSGRPNQRLLVDDISPGDLALCK